jgi:hydrogenase expression/formation protein HypD
MKYVDEFRDKRLIEKVACQICEAARTGRGYRFMEVCGTHTMSIFRFGLKDLLPDNIKLLSGPGCPVCVTPNSFIDKAIALSKMENVIIATFGDMFRVPGSHSSLEKEKARGATIKMVYSTEDALAIAKAKKNKEIVFLGVGFETTIPTVACSIVEAYAKGINNYSVLCGHKTMPKALEALVGGKNISVDGFILPGHVSAVIGTHPYEFLARRYNRRCVVSGFEPLDIVQSILMLINQGTSKVEIQYTRIMDSGGNLLARKVMDEVFGKATSEWRGMGNIDGSGLKIKPRYKRFDAERKFSINVKGPVENRNCRCGEVLQGLVEPTACRLFGRICTPENPVGACMVSGEGACAAHYRYGDR